jgi:uncharacterized protein YndB with AHSA1/START domain
MVNVNAQLTAVDRDLRDTDIDGAPGRVERVAQTYPSPIADVWSAVTEPARIARWFSPVGGEFEPGGKYQIEGNAGGSIVECSPPAGDTAHYLITWEFAGAVSWVTVRLSVSGEGTRFELEHLAKNADVPDGMWDQFGPGAIGVGWDGALMGLSQHLTSPETAMTPAQGEEWALTDEGKSFYRGAADAWGDASVSYGIRQDDAKRQADATYGFYTGQAG